VALSLAGEELAMSVDFCEVCPLPVALCNALYYLRSALQALHEPDLSNPLGWAYFWFREFAAALDEIRALDVE
jgi:hypothetical protein